eukprot:2799885-Pyramimonas_sp.AAC.1
MAAATELPQRQPPPQLGPRPLPGRGEEGPLGQRQPCPREARGASRRRRRRHQPSRTWRHRHPPPTTEVRRAHGAAGAGCGAGSQVVGGTPRGGEVLRARAARRRRRRRCEA